MAQNGKWMRMVEDLVRLSKDEIQNPWDKSYHDLYASPKIIHLNFWSIQSITNLIHKWILALKPTLFNEQKMLLPHNGRQSDIPLNVAP